MCVSSSDAGWKASECFQHPFGDKMDSVGRI